MNKFIVVYGQNAYEEEPYFFGWEIYEDLKQAKAFCDGFEFCSNECSADNLFCYIFNHLDFENKELENKIKLYLERCGLMNQEEQKSMKQDELLLDMQSVANITQDSKIRNFATEAIKRAKGEL